MVVVGTGAVGVQRTDDQVAAKLRLPDGVCCPGLRKWGYRRRKSARPLNVGSEKSRDLDAY